MTQSTLARAPGRAAVAVAPRASARFALLLLSALLYPATLQADPLVIAHRGASGYLPEHTAEAQAMAVGQGADFIEYDVVLSRDGVPVVLHDITLDTVTDVASRHPGRARPDGRFYVIDFDMAELAGLRVLERFDPRSNEPVFPGRFPHRLGEFRIVTLSDAIALVQGLERSTGHSIGIYPEIKRPAWHRQEGRDISRIVLDTLAAAGYGGAGDERLYLQCFDWAETQRIRDELGYQGPLVQLIGRNSWADAAGTDYDALLTDPGLAELAAIVDGIGPFIGLLVDAEGSPTDLGTRAATVGLDVHAYTVRADALPDWAPDLATLVDGLVEAGATGLFTDHPDQVLEALGR